MATKVIRVSDISGKEATDEQLGRLIIHEHPEFSDMPVSLDVLPDELGGLEPSSRFVVLEWIGPGQRSGSRMTVSLENFNLLAPPGAMDNAMQEALISKHRTRSRTGGGREATPGRAAGGRGKKSYATLEHAGEPHRGRITEAEKELVRNNLDQVNRRLRDSGLREIDPADPTMKERYGL